MSPGVTRKRPLQRLPHQLLLQHPEDLDLDVMRRRALLGLQVRAGLDASPADKGVYETDAWDPSKPFVADKLLRLPCMRGKPVVYSCSTVSLKPKQGACGGAEGTIAEDCTIQCAGCSFRGGRTRYEQHLGSGSKKVSQHLWMKEERISIKDLAVLCSAVDLNVWHCCYCRSDEPPTNTTRHTQQAPTAGVDDADGSTAAAGTAAAATGAGSPAAAAAAAAAGGSGEAESGGGLQLNRLVTCSTCPGAFHTSCYQHWTGEQVGADDEWQCISCRQGAACAAAGCCWCAAHHPQQRGFTMLGLFRDLLSELQPQPAVREGGEGPGLAGTAGRAAGEQAAAAPGPGLCVGVADSGQRLSLKRPASSSGAAQLGPEPRATPAPTPTPATPRVAPPAAAVAQAPPPAAAAAAAGCEGGKVASLRCPPALRVTATGLVVHGGGAAAAGPLTPAGLLTPEQVARQQPGSSSPTAGMALLAAFGSGGGANGGAGAAGAAAGATAAAAAAARNGGGGAAAAAAAAVAAAAAGEGDQPGGGAAGPCSPPPAKRARRQNGSTAAAAAGRAQTRATDQQRQQRQSQPQQQQKEELQQEQGAPSQQQPCVPAPQQQGQQQQQQQPLAPFEQQQQQPLAPVPKQQQQQQQQQQPPSSGQHQAPLLPLLGLLNRAVPWLPVDSWTNHYAAEASIYCLLDRAGAPDAVVAQAQGVLGALRGLPPTHLAVCRFQANYILMQLWARRRNGPQVEAALRRLLSPG